MSEEYCGKILILHVCVWRQSNLAEALTNMGGKMFEFPSRQLFHLRIYIVRQGIFSVITKLKNSIVSFEALSRSLLTNYPVIRL
jgi:hypothetical protein